MINYEILNKSISYYQINNFNRIETPWIVSDYVNCITKPDYIPSLYVNTNTRALIASGEQAFLQLYLLEQLPKGQFQTVTPCFRDEQEDFTHQKYFIKNELIKTNNISNDELDKLVDICYKFFSNYINDKNLLNVIKTSEGYDIELNKIEIGSYGIRECEFLSWIYGTGVAEPRFSKLVELYGLS